MTAHKSKSVAISRIIQAISFAALCFIVYYTVIYALVLKSGDESRFVDFMSYKSSVLAIVPFFIVVLFFVMAIWVYSLYTDLFRRFPKFEYGPMNAMLLVFLPIINIYGTGLVMIRVINYLDREISIPFYEKISMRLKVGLSIFYAGLSALIISLLFGLTLPNYVELFDWAEMIVFNITELVIITVALIGLLIYISGCNSMLRKENPA